MTKLRASGVPFCSHGSVKRLRSQRCWCVSTMRGCFGSSWPAWATSATAATPQAAADCMRKPLRSMGEGMGREPHVPEATQIRNPNTEIRNKSEYRNPKFKTNAFGSLGHSDFGFVSDFDIRISDLACYVGFGCAFRIACMLRLY